MSIVPSRPFSAADTAAGQIATVRRTRSVRRPYFPNFQANYPCRPTDWRWQRALDLVTSRRNASRKRDDPPTCRAVAYVRACHHAGTERAFRKVAMGYPDLFLASRWYQELRSPRLELECRILARQPPELIAEIMSLPLHAVETFGVVFFDLEGRLDALDYIANVVVALNPVGPSPPEAWMKLAAYHHGPHVIDAFLDYMAHAEESHDLTSPEGRQRESIALFLDAQTLALPDDSCSRSSALKVLWTSLASPPVYRSPGSIMAELAEKAVNRLLKPTKPVSAHGAGPVQATRRARQTRRSGQELRAS